MGQKKWELEGSKNREIETKKDTKITCRYATPDPYCRRPFIRVVRDSICRKHKDDGWGCVAYKLPSSSPDVILLSLLTTGGH